ncbi:PilZ domain-containing protein [Microvirga rosea]|uniref:PilZ domain-containing protein n=1 Tax=Microvirga rosea TaxID=2715425 RepID=UPI001D0A7277|nr:PilZ domain-containing protein [Microvirga rosea]MCB8822062.1 PilZ domain-containing protein [Microvirga rosea]
MVYWLDQRCLDNQFRSMIQGQVILDSSYSPIACSITGLSASGARIEISEPLNVSSELELIVPAKFNVRAKVAWSEGSDHGLTFLKSLENDISALPETSEIAQFIVQEALDEARRKIAAALNSPVSTIALTFETVL